MVASSARSRREPLRERVYDDASVAAIMDIHPATMGLGAAFATRADGSLPI
jgi:hypothetical protein